MSAASSERSVRERILSTAGQLFYRRGYHAVGVDTIIAESGVAKMSLYRHFPSKDALIAAYLERANAQVLALLDEAAASEAEPLARLRALVAQVARIATGPQCLGCVFQMSAAEFPERDHPAHQVAVAHKLAVRGRLLDLARLAGLRDPQVLSDQLLLLIDGAWIAARMFGPESPATSLIGAADALIEAQQ
ncbi:MAG: TetR/AcrR family transcriptional regulator [Chloroflexales bacterium]|nr:TetR/AcrR family transcriptional regulator [Chloroflexales bacterium]